MITATIGTTEEGIAKVRASTQVEMIDQLTEYVKDGWTIIHVGLLSNDVKKNKVKYNYEIQMTK